MKTITFRQLAAIKRVAQNVNALVQKKNKIANQITALNKEYNDLMSEIEGHEMGVLSLTGYTSEALVTRVVTANKTSKYEIKPEALQWDAEKKVYNLLLEDNIPLSEVNPTEIDAAPDTPEDMQEGDIFPQDIMDNIITETAQV